MRITNKEQWLEMYKAAERVRDLEAWNWMYEDDMVAVFDPNNSSRIGFCSLMGSGGEFSALAIYQNIEGLYTWSDLREGAEEEEPNEVSQLNLMLQQKCWMIEFTDADAMTPSSKETLKELGLKYRGAGKWIDISNRQPGVFPWHIDEEDVPFITACINQFFDVAMRAEENEAILRKPNPEYKEMELEEDSDMDEFVDSLLHSEDLMLQRVAKTEQEGKWMWEDAYFDPFNETKFPIPVQRITPSIRAVALNKKLKKRDAAILVGMIMFPQPVQDDKKEKPYFLCLNTFIQYGSGYILAQDLSKYDEAKGKFEKNLLDLFEKIGFIPSQIVANMPVLMDWLESFEELFEIETILEPNDETFIDVFESLKDSGLY